MQFDISKVALYFVQLACVAWIRHLGSEQGQQFLVLCNRGVAHHIAGECQVARGGIYAYMPAIASADDFAADDYVIAASAYRALGVGVELLQDALVNDFLLLARSEEHTS